MNPNIIVIHDPTGRMAPQIAEMCGYAAGRKFATLSISDNLEPVEVAATAARLGLLLLEQIAPPQDVAPADRPHTI